MTRAEIIKKTLGIINSRRTEAERAAAEAYADAMRDKGFAAAETRYKTLMSRVAMQRAYGNLTPWDAIALADAESERNAVLKDLKIDLNPIYVCGKCQDTGIDPDGSHCSCYREIYLSLLKKSCNLNSLADFTFEQSRLPANAGQYDTMKLLYNKMEQFCDKFPLSKNKVWLFSGEMGVGKTCLVSAVANRLLERGFGVLYLTAFELNNLFLRYHTGALENRDAIKDVTECDMLIIDDLGVEPIFKNVTLEYLFNTINLRLNNGKHIMISTNLNEDEILNRYGERIYSRLSAKNNSFHYKISGDDLRKK